MPAGRGATALFIAPGPPLPAGRRPGHQLPRAPLVAADAGRRRLPDSTPIRRGVQPCRRDALPVLQLRRRHGDSLGGTRDSGPGPGVSGTAKRFTACAVTLTANPACPEPRAPGPEPRYALVHETGLRGVRSVGCACAIRWRRGRARCGASTSRAPHVAGSDRGRLRGAPAEAARGRRVHRRRRRDRRRTRRRRADRVGAGRTRDQGRPVAGAHRPHGARLGVGGGAERRRRHPRRRDRAGRRAPPRTSTRRSGPGASAWPRKPAPASTTR